MKCDQQKYNRLQPSQVVTRRCSAKIMLMPPLVQKIEPGDVWTLAVNNQTIVRYVHSVTDDMVTYGNNDKICQCKLLTFRQWARSAELTSREEWYQRGIESLELAHK